MLSRAARYVNGNLSEYLVPVNADICHVEVMMLAQANDAVNPTGIKGIGGVNVAIDTRCITPPDEGCAPCDPNRATDVIF